MKKPKKNKILTLRLTDKILEEYKTFCKENNITISKRIRKFIEKDLENWKIKKLIENQKNKELK